MTKQQLKAVIMVGFFCLVAGVAMGTLDQAKPVNVAGTSENGAMTISGRLVQEKIFSGGDGLASFAFTMHADEMMAAGQAQPLDLVIVLDRSGSMEGQKLEYAKQAVQELLSKLSEQDRLAIIGYSDHVWKYAEMLPVTSVNRARLLAVLSDITADGGTNLGAGMEEGIQTLLANRREGHLGKVILISDGLANKGVTSPDMLGNMASIAAEKAFMVSTVGVGQDFNAQLMIAIANRGAGNYYYLAQAEAFTEFFRKEFQNSKRVAAYGIEVRIPLPPGVSLVNAAGYPITLGDGYALFRPGDLLAGETRKLFLTLHLSPDAGRTYELSGITAHYLHHNEPFVAQLDQTFLIACVANPDEAVASVDKNEWEEKVLNNDFGFLQQNVASSLQNRDRESALRYIEEYEAQQQQLNSYVGSTTVSTHLEKEINEMRRQVEQKDQKLDADIIFKDSQFKAPRALSGR